MTTTKTFYELAHKKRNWLSIRFSSRRTLTQQQKYEKYSMPSKRCCHLEGRILPPLFSYLVNCKLTTAPFTDTQKCDTVEKFTRNRTHNNKEDGRTPHRQSKHLPTLQENSLVILFLAGTRFSPRLSTTVVKTRSRAPIFTVNSSGLGSFSLPNTWPAALVVKSWENRNKWNKSILPFAGWQSSRKDG